MRITPILLLFLCATSGYAQYSGEQVMEKSFEQTDFFFMPYQLTPYGIGTFANSVAGVLDDPLLNLDISPANLYKDSLRPSYLYLDFRSATDVRDTRSVYFPYPLLTTDRIAGADAYYPYPAFYINTRRELEPLVSAAYLIRPVEGALKDFSFGLSYQLVSQDEKYYPIPQDIYKSVLGSDYSGIRTAGADNAPNVPITDAYLGTDYIHQEGHFVSLFAGYEAGPQLRLGGKISRVTFDRDGSYGSQNIWQNYSAGSGTSLWRNVEARNQTYKHWEFTGGADYAPDPELGIGLSAGHLSGDADQALTRNDSSYWAYGPLYSQTSNWSVSSSSGLQSQVWNHSGRSTFLAAHLKALVRDGQTLQLHYQYTRQTTDITLGGTIVDTSYGLSRYESSTYLYSSTSDYGLVDQRDGTGTTIGNIHKAIGSFQWDVNSTLRLSLGLLYELRNIETNTSEDVFAYRHSRYTSSGSYPYEYFDSTSESKTLFWEFTTRLTRFTIPILFTIRTSNVVELTLGLNRSASNWRADDVTLALFDHRFHASLQDTTLQRNFGERYTTPSDRSSDVQTTLLMGVTVAPTKSFNVRFLVVPNFVETYDGTDLSDFHAWLSINVMP